MTETLSLLEMSGIDRSLGPIPAHIADWTTRETGVRTDIIVAQLAGFYCEPVPKDEQRVQNKFWIRSSTNGSDRGFCSADTPENAWADFLDEYFDPSVDLEQAWASILEGQYKPERWVLECEEIEADMLLRPLYGVSLYKDGYKYTGTAATLEHALCRAFIRMRCEQPAAFDERAVIDNREIAPPNKSLLNLDAALQAELANALGVSLDEALTVSDALDEADQTDDLEFLSEATLAALRAGNFRLLEQKPRSWTDDLEGLQL